MRNLIYGINMTIDGCVDHTKSTSNEEVHEYFTDLIRNADLLVYGRITYELMVPFWPDIAKNQSGQTKTMNDFALTFDATKKVVFSQSLERVEDKNTRIIRTNLQEEIYKLKQEEGGNILTGGVDLPSQLIASGLIDEYHIVIHPIFAGKGRRLLEEISLQEQLSLKLAESTIMKSGYVALRYLKQ